MKKIVLGFLILLISVASVKATPVIEVSNGGLLGLPGEFTNKTINAIYGETLFIRVTENGTLLDYTITVDSRSIGDTDNSTIFYTLTKTGMQIIESIPATTNVTVDVTEPVGWEYWLAHYLAFIKTSLPSLTGTLSVDTILWAVFIIPVGSAICLKLLIIVLRGVM